MMIPRRVPVHQLRLGDVVLFGRKRVHVTYSRRLLGSEFFTKLGGFLGRDHALVKLTIDSNRRLWVVQRRAFLPTPYFTKGIGLMLEARPRPLEIQNSRVRTNV